MASPHPHPGVSTLYTSHLPQFQQNKTKHPGSHCETDSTSSSLPFLSVVSAETPSSLAATELSSPGLWFQEVPSSTLTPRGSLKPSEDLGGSTLSQKSESSNHLEKQLKIGTVSPRFLGSDGDTHSPGSDGDTHSPTSHFSSEQKAASLVLENGTTLSSPTATAILGFPISTTQQPAASGTPSMTQPQVVTRARLVITDPPESLTGLVATLWGESVTSHSVSTTMMTTTTTTTTAIAKTMTTVPSTSSQTTTVLKGTPQTVPFRETSSLTLKPGVAHKPVTLPSSTLDSALVNRTTSQETDHQLAAFFLNRLLLEKCLLISSLIFGVLFLVIGLFLMGKKFLESLHRKRYSRLDYLINGIYVDI